MNRHKEADYKMKSDMLEDMRHDDEETTRMIKSLEDNIKKRYESFNGEKVDAYQAFRRAIWDTFKW